MRLLLRKLRQKHQRQRKDNYCDTKTTGLAGSFSLRYRRVMDEQAIEELYHTLITAWNNRDTKAFAALFADEGDVVGFDGSQLNGRGSIETELASIFLQHRTAPFVSKVEEVRFLSADIALLRAIVGMPKEDTKEINPDVNAIQSMIARKEGEGWKIELFQNTPASFHGRPELVAQMTAELQKLVVA